MIKLLHTADLHLDSPNSSLDFASAEAMREEQRQVFKKIMNYASENETDIILICGDLFDGKYICRETKELVINTFASLSCPVVIAPGNHDPYNAISLYRSGELPENVYVFSSDEMQIFDFDKIGVSVCGYAFLSDRLERSPIRDFVPRNTVYPLVLCAHADLGASNSKYAPVSESDIEKCGFAYAALGHIHNFSENDMSERIKYCGFPIGRSFDETGYGGVYKVTLDGESISTERIVFSNHRFLNESLDVSLAESDSDIEKLISEHVTSKQYGKETSLCIELCGTLPFGCIPDTDKLSKAAPQLRSLKIKDATVALPDTDRLGSDLTLRGELYRTLRPLLESNDINERRKASLALRIGLYAIDGKNISDILDTNSTQS